MEHAHFVQFVLLLLEVEPRACVYQSLPWSHANLGMFSLEALLDLFFWECSSQSFLEEQN